MTDFETIYEDFLLKIDDIELANYDDDLADETLLGYLRQAVKSFHYCSQDLTLDENSGSFNVELTPLEIDIISEFMVVKWLKPKLDNLENLRNALNTNDHSFYSPANLLKQVSERYRRSVREAKSLMNEYTLLASDYDKWAR